MCLRWDLFSQLDTSHNYYKSKLAIFLQNHHPSDLPTDGATAVHRACYDGSHEALQLLIEYSADLGVLDGQGRAPVHWATASVNLKCLEVSNGIIIFLKNVDDRRKSVAQNIVALSVWFCSVSVCSFINSLCSQHASVNLLLHLKFST